MKKHLKTVWTHIRRSPYQALAAVGIMSLTFFLVSVLAVGSFISERLLKYAESRPQVSVYFKDEATENDIISLKQKIEATEKVELVKYISKEEALKLYKKIVKEDEKLVTMVTPQMLPASLEISTVKPEDLMEIAKMMSNEPLVESIELLEEVVQKMMTTTQTARKVGIAFVFFLAGEAFLITLLIIGMRTALKKREIGILTLLGATRSYIQAPFLLEGIFYGLAGAVLGWGVAYLLFLYSTPALASYFQMISILPIPFSFMGLVLGAEILTGVMIGSFGSFLAVRRYL